MMDIDLNITNSKDHPTNINYLVYWFNSLEKADFFENELKNFSVYYERDTDPKEDEEQKFYFAVRKSDRRSADKANYLTIGNFREKTIPGKALQIGVVVISIIVLTLAVIGYVKTNA